ncbi:MAG: ABC transporter ATP-binding protein [Verrucomicrobiales bacterium]
MEQRRLTDLQILRRLLRQARPLAPLLAGMFLLNILAAPLALLVPLPLKIAVDHVIADQPLPWFLAAITPDFAKSSKEAMLVFTACLVVAITLLLQAQNVATHMAESFASEKLVLSFRSRLFRHAQRLSLLYHDRKGTADSIYRIQYDAPAIEWILVHGITPFLVSGCTVVGMVYIIAQTSAQLVLVALTVMPVLFALAEFYRRRIRTRWGELQNVQSATMSVLEETLGAIRVVKAFGQEERQQAEYIDKASLGVRRHVYISFLDSGFGAVVGVAVACGTAAALFVGVQHVQSGAMTLGQLLIVMAYVAQLYGPMKTISTQIGKMQASMSSAERSFKLLDESPDVTERPNARPLPKARGEIEFRDVSFGYEAGSLVLHGVSFQVRPGTRVGILGSTGAGKTTLVSLLTRFYDPTSGQILLDGVDLREFRLSDLRSQFAIVLQEPVLFSNSIAENIAYARPGASRAQIVNAAKAANAHDFISALADGYNTLVGQRGASLSGGERQRISLARAFLKNAPVLVLDEPTSSVDMKTEAGIMDAMCRLMSGRTTFIIAHRLTTLEGCDVRLEIEKGRLVGDQSAAPVAV